MPVFETDEDRTYLETTIFIRDGFEKNVMSESMSERVSKLMAESMSELEAKRMDVLLTYLKNREYLSSNMAADLLSVEVKTASRLLGKAEKVGMLKSEGKTKNKKYKIKAMD